MITSAKSRIYLNSITEIFLIISLMIISVASPLLTHAMGIKGTEFLPIFFALSLSSGILSTSLMITLAVAAPVLNSVITGMPPIPVLYFLMFEGVVFSLLIIAGRKLDISFYILVILSFIIARFSSIALLPLFDTVTLKMWFFAILNGYKGIIVNIIFASALYGAFKIRSDKQHI